MGNAEFVGHPGTELKPARSGRAALTKLQLAKPQKKLLLTNRMPIEIRSAINWIDTDRLAVSRTATKSPILTCRVGVA